MKSETCHTVMVLDTVRRSTCSYGSANGDGFSIDIWIVSVDSGVRQSYINVSRICSLFDEL